MAAMIVPRCGNRQTCRVRPRGHADDPTRPVFRPVAATATRPCQHDVRPGPRAPGGRRIAGIGEHRRRRCIFRPIAFADSRWVGTSGATDVDAAAAIEPSAMREPVQPDGVIDMDPGEPLAARPERATDEQCGTAGGSAVARECLGRPRRAPSGRGSTRTPMRRRPPWRLARQATTIASEDRIARCGSASVELAVRAVAESTSITDALDE